MAPLEPLTPLATMVPMDHHGQIWITIAANSANGSIVAITFFGDPIRDITVFNGTIVAIKMAQMLTNCGHH